MRWILVMALVGNVAYTETVREKQTKMGSPFILTAVHEDEDLAKAAIAAAWQEIDRLEAMISSWRQTSETSAVNRAAGLNPVVVSPETYGLINRALKVSSLSGGAFDITFASAGRFWDFRSGELPDPAAVAKAVEAIDYRNVLLDPDKQTVFLVQPGTRIGFGAIGKGYAANRALRVMVAMGIKSALVNAGGDLVATGVQEDGAPWQISIQHPRERKRLLAQLRITEQAVVTSGDYERFFMVDGKRYSHIIDPRTGYPVEGMQSVTVICPDAELADALATTVFVLGAEKGLELVNRLKSVDAIVVDATGTVTYSLNIHDQIMDGPVSNTQHTTDK